MHEKKSKKNGKGIAKNFTEPAIFLYSEEQNQIQQISCAVLYSLITGKHIWPQKF